MNRVIGIDPGVKGGIAIIEDGMVRVFNLPPRSMKKGLSPADRTKEMLRADEITFRMIAAWSPAIAVIEHVSSSPQMGPTSAFTFGGAFACVRLSCIAAGMNPNLVRPQQWKRHFGLLVYGDGLGGNPTAKKNLDKEKAKELFPDVSVTHATADALLIAEYGRRLLLKASKTKSTF